MFLKNKNIIFKIRRSKVTDYAALKEVFFSLIGNYLRPSNNSKQLIFNINAVVLIVLFC